MRGAEVVHVDTSTLAGPPTGRSGVVQVDVGDKHVGDVAGGQVVSDEGLFQRREGGARAAFDQNRAAAVGNQVGGDGVGEALEVKIEGVNRVCWGHGYSLSRQD